MSASPLRSVLRAPGVRWLLVTSLIARLPSAMIGLAIVLHITRNQGSYASAGGISASYVVGAALFGPVLGRLVDRVGRRPVLVASGLANAAGQLVLSTLPAHAIVALLLVAAVSGAATPPVTPTVRSQWPQLVGPELSNSVFSVDSTMQELTFIIGPALVAVIGSAAGSTAPLVASAVFGLFGATVLAWHPAMASTVRVEPAARRQPSSAADPKSDTPLAGTSMSRELMARESMVSGPLVVLLGAIFCIIGSFGVVELGIVSFATHHHASSQAGVMLGTWSAGSLVGGIVLGTRAAAAGPRVLPPLVAMIGIGLALLATATAPIEAYPLLLVAGFAIAPSLGVIYILAGELAPPGRTVEAFSWLSSALLAGAATGAAVGGIVVQHFGSRVDDVVAATAALAGAGFTLLLPRAQRSA